MKRRANAWDGRASALPWEDRWVAQAWDGDWEDGPHEDPEWSIEDCPSYTIRRFPTHAEALAHALAEVGLTEKNSAARRDEEKRDG